MEDIKQNCKECGHENPKKFMNQEYISHAPDCSHYNIPVLKKEKDKFIKWYEELINPPLETVLMKRVDVLIDLAVKQEQEKFKKAFYQNFKGAGELWFTYGDDIPEEDKLEEVNNQWDNIVSMINNN